MKEGGEDAVAEGGCELGETKLLEDGESLRRRDDCSICANAMRASEISGVA